MCLHSEKSTWLSGKEIGISSCQANIFDNVMSVIFAQSPFELGPPARYQGDQTLEVASRLLE